MWKYYDRPSKAFRQLTEPETIEILNAISVVSTSSEQIFAHETGEEFIPIGGLVPTRARVKGIINAAVRMEEAMQGGREKRSPISVEYDPTLEKFLVLDGNSTYFMCVFWGLNSLPCIIRK